jgi:hypothetical protein
LKRKTASSKPKPKSKTKKKENLEDILGQESKGEIAGLLTPEQPLFYFGPPPAIKALTKRQDFDKNFHPMDLLAHMREGSSRSEICAAWGITYSLLNSWLETYPEMSEAYAVGKPAYDAYYKRALRHSAFGQNKTVRENSLFFMLKNVAGYVEDGGSHEFGDGQAADIEFIDDDE